MMDSLIQALTDASLIDRNGHILLIAPNRKPQTVSQKTFRLMFGDIKDNPTYASLSDSHTFQVGNLPYSITATAKELGYQDFFDEWKNKGIIS